ncbi:YhgE/Pip domain-containing protein, partial [Streptococcus suis]
SPIILVFAVMAIGVNPSYVGRTFVIAILAAWSMMALVTALVGWDRRYGSFISMIILLLQLGASAGTYPIQLSNKFFETVQPYLPMSYAVSG